MNCIFGEHGQRLAHCSLQILRTQLSRPIEQCLGTCMYIYVCMYMCMFLNFFSVLQQ